MPRLVMLCDVNLADADATRTHTTELARAFAGTFAGVDLVARGPDPGIEGVRYWRCGGQDRQRLARLVGLNVRACALLLSRRRVARHFYVRDSWSCLPAVVLARLASYRVVCQVDGVPYGSDPTQPPNVPLAAIRRLVATLVGRLAHGIRAVTPQIASLLTELARVPSGRIGVVPNGVDTDFFHPLDRQRAIARAGLAPDASYVVYCGGLHPWNDFDTLLRSFAEAARRHGEARLLIVGDGQERGAICARVAELGIGRRVVLTGAVDDRARVRDYLAAATVTVLPYRAEVVARTSASPLKLFEYMACGRGVLAFDYPGVCELLRRSGAGVTVDGAADASAALASLLGDGRADEYGAAGRRYAEEHLTWQRVVAQTLPLFER
jgi:glycosyltransferase involved in cell wall biosynthesis